MNVEVAVAHPAELGEGPVWDPARQRLVWVDILGSAVHQFDPATGADEVMATGQHVGAALPRAGGGLVANLRDGIGLYDADGSFRWLVRHPEEGVRGNDAAVAPDGSLWAGTLRYDEAAGGGKLRRVSPGGETVTVLDAVTISNGLGWSPDGELMYYVDTPTGCVDVFTIDSATGLPGDRRTFARIAGPGVPDGLTVDAEGRVWVALWGGGAVQCYRTDGSLDRTVEFPVSLTTACAFGGSSLRDLYVTSATAALSDQERAQQPEAGYLFVIPDIAQGTLPALFPG